MSCFSSSRCSATITSVMAISVVWMCENQIVNGFSPSSSDHFGRQSYGPLLALFSHPSSAATCDSATTRRCALFTKLCSISQNFEGEHEPGNIDTSPTRWPLSPSFQSLSRRGWLVGIAHGAAATAPFLHPPGLANAASDAAVLAEPPSSSPPRIITTAASCDPTVSVWRLASSGRSLPDGTVMSDRIVYLLGTAHISQVSAQLAGQLVQDVQPNAVFVELDLKRVMGGSSVSTKLSNVAGSAPSASTPDTSPSTETATGEPDARPRSRIIVTRPMPSSMLMPPGTNPDRDGSMIPALGGSDSNEDLLASQPKRRGGGLFAGIREAAMTVGAATIGSVLKNVYKNLDQSGFSPGEEFITAIRQGQLQGADIVLGDQDVQVTLRRLTHALSVTNLEPLLDPNSEFEKSMSELFPTINNNSADPTTMSRDEFSAYIESLKSRESVRKIMSQLREVAPALVQVMLTERDAYMAAGLDSLNQFGTIVAVMGIAHMDGVEMNLQAQGWKQVSLKCPPR